MRTGNVGLFLTLLAAPLAVLLLVVGCSDPEHTTRAVAGPESPPAVTAVAAEQPPQAPDVSNDYLGDAACARCHSDAFRAHQRSRHRLAVRPVTASVFARRFASSQPFADPTFQATYRQQVQDALCVSEVRNPEGQSRITARYAMGDERVGTTFLGQDALGNWFEMRLTYYSRLHRWDYTPNLQPGGSSRMEVKGLPLDKRQLGICLSCHLTTIQMQADGTLTPNAHLGIGCERCHGPGKAHVAAVEARFGPQGASPRLSASGDRVDLKMEPLKGAPRDRVVDGCNVCHSAPSDIPRSPEYAVSLAQFAGTALKQSRCYLRSGTLSCLYCHDAHSLSAPRQGGYEGVCLSCHRSASVGGRNAAEAGGSPVTNLAQASVCRVSPRSGCIRCHMPVQTVPSFSRIGFHNHWIGIYEGTRPAH